MRKTIPVYKEQQNYTFGIQLAFRLGSVFISSENFLMSLEYSRQ